MAGKLEQANKVANSISNSYIRDLALGETAPGLNKAGKTELAEQIFGKILEFANDKPWVLGDIAVIFTKAEKFDRAERAFRKALEISEHIENPYDKSGNLLQIAVCLMKAGKQKMAIEKISMVFLYLVAILDWFSRYVLSWRLSSSLDVCFCKEALEEALEKGCPDIFKTDQGSQFTSDDFTGILRGKGVAISMDGRGRVFDNIFTERLWRTVKYEEVYIKGYQIPAYAQAGLGKYFPFYNDRRYHQALAYKTPHEVHYGPHEKN